jgi:hypothetical protein
VRFPDERNQPKSNSAGLPEVRAHPMLRVLRNDTGAFEPTRHHETRTNACSDTEPILPAGMVGMTSIIDRKALKLLAQASQRLSEMVGEGLCEEPQKKLVQALLGEVRSMLDEFEDAYFND